MSIEGKRVAALIGDGFEEAELAEPRQALESAGAIVTIVGTDEKIAPTAYEASKGSMTAERRRPRSSSRT